MDLGEWGDGESLGGFGPGKPWLENIVRKKKSIFNNIKIINNKNQSDQLINDAAASDTSKKGF